MEIDDTDMMILLDQLIVLTKKSEKKDKPTYIENVL